MAKRKIWKARRNLSEVGGWETKEGWERGKGERDNCEDDRREEAREWRRERSGGPGGTCQEGGRQKGGGKGVKMRKR